MSHLLELTSVKTLRGHLGCCVVIYQSLYGAKHLPQIYLFHLMDIGVELTLKSEHTDAFEGSTYRERPVPGTVSRTVGESTHERGTRLCENKALSVSSRDAAYSRSRRQTERGQGPFREL